METTIHFVCIVVLHVTVNCINILCCTTMALWQIMSPIKLIKVKLTLEQAMKAQRGVEV
jgi:hypothetical protein